MCLAGLLRHTDLQYMKRLLQYMLPCFPSKTFPNHYSMATGLFPESHGLVDNYVYDPDVAPHLEDVRRPGSSARFYLGEPIWSAAVRQRRRVFCMFWAGCSHNITGFNPQLDLPYNKSMPYSTRVEMLADWLSLPAHDRPALILAYFDQPDDVGHWKREDGPVNLELTYIEAVLNYMFTLFRKRGLLDCTNIVLVSDHGMQKLDKRVYVDSLLSNTRVMEVASGVLGRLHLNNSGESLLEPLARGKQFHFCVTVSTAYT